MDLMTKTKASCKPLQTRLSSNVTFAPTLDWSEMNGSDHFVQFYERDVSLVDAVSGFIGAGLEAGEVCIVIAARAHREDIESNLKARGLDLCGPLPLGNEAA